MNLATLIRINGYLWMAWGIFWLVTSFKASKAVRRESLISRFLHVWILVVVFITLFSPSFENTALLKRWLPMSTGIEVLGTVLTAAGIQFSIWARVHLGRNWSATVTIKKDHELIQSGPYRFVRHPIYTGMLFALFGCAITLGELRGLIAVFFAFGALWLKLKREEEFMTEQFGERYTEYKRRTKAVIPLIL